MLLELLKIPKSIENNFLFKVFFGGGAGECITGSSKNMLQYFETICRQWKAFDLLYKIRYILRVVALLEVCDVTKNGRHLGRHLVRMPIL